MKGGDRNSSTTTKGGDRISSTHDKRRRSHQQHPRQKAVHGCARRMVLRSLPRRVEPGRLRQGKSRLPPQDTTTVSTSSEHNIRP